MKKHLLLLPLLATAIGGNLSAQTVSEADACAKAVNFLSGGSHRAKGESSMQLAYKAANNDETYFYVFNYGDNEGYVIIGGDEAAQDVLAYGESGHFDYEALPPQMKWWLGDYEAQIHEAIRQVRTGEAVLCNTDGRKNAPQQTATKNNIEFLLATKWDQIAPYNSQIPLNLSGLSNEYAFATGCVATAGAQVMKYHNWPDHGEGSHQLKTTNNGTTYAANFEETTYEWSKMSNEYSTGNGYGVYSGTESELAVGTLMYHVGVSVDMEYGQLKDGGSSASCYTLAKSLATYFKYSKGISYEERSTYSNTEWEELIYSELAAARPVVYRGSSDEGGHAFVCDGYKDGRFHINWGWSGHYNDYFLLTPTATEMALCPDGTGSGGSSAGSSYTKEQAAIIGITPDPDGTSIVHKAMLTDGNYLDQTSSAPGDMNILRNAIFSMSFFTTDFTYGIRYVNVNNENDVVIAPMHLTYTLEPHKGSTYHPFQVSKDLTVGETYYIYPMFLGEDGTWKQAQISTGATIATLTIVAPDGLVLSKDVEISNNGYISPSSANISFKVKNYGEEGSKSIIMWILDSNWNSYKYYWDNNSAYTVNQEKGYNITWSNIRNYSSTELTVGNKYEILVKDYSASKDLSPHVPFYYVNDLTVTFNMSSAGWCTICLPFEAEVPNGLTAYSVTDVNGSSLTLQTASKLEMNTPYLLSGTAGTYTFTGPDTPTGSKYRSGLLIGNTSPSTSSAYVYAPAGSYVLQNQNGVLGFYKVENNDSQKIRQYSAYLKLTSDSESMPKCFTLGNVESIEELEAEEPEHSTRQYNLNGQAVGAGYKGLVIKNGKVSFQK